MFILILIGACVLGIYLVSGANTTSDNEKKSSDKIYDAHDISLLSEDLQKVDGLSGSQKDQLISSMLIGGMLEENERESSYSSDYKVDLLGGNDSNSGSSSDDSSGNDGF